MGNDIFNYGSYAIDKNTLLRTLLHEDNIRDYSRYRSYTPEEDSEFRNIVQYLHSGILNGTISGDGFGNFTDATQNPYKNNRAYGEALNYIHRVANEIGNIKAEQKPTSAEKFNVGKHSFLSYFLNQLDPFNSDGKYDQSVKDYLELYKDDEVGKILDFVTKLENYQTQYNNFSGIDFGEFGLTSELYNNSLNKLKEGLKDGTIDTSDKVLANNLGIGNIINALFDLRLNVPKQSNKFDLSKHGFKSYFAKSIASPFSMGNSYTTDLQDYILGYPDQGSKIKDFTDKITAWLKSNNNFSDLDFSSYGLTPEQFNEGLENLKQALADGQIDHNDKMLAKNLGLSDVVNDVFGLNFDFSQSLGNQEFKNELLELNWTINNEGKWVMPNGAVTKFKLEENPVEKIAQMTKKEYNLNNHLQNPDSVGWWNSMTSSDLKRMWSILCDVISIIDPEPFSAAGLGYTSDYLTHQADKEDGDVSWGRTALNVGLSTLGAVPIVGDMVLGSRIGKNIGKVTKTLGLMLGIPSVAMLVNQMPEIKVSLNKFIDGAKNMSVDDWRNIYNVFTVVLGGTNALRTLFGKMKANKHLVDSEQGLSITVNRNGKDENIVFKSLEEIDAVKSIKDPEELKKYLKDNYEGFDDVKILDVKTTKNTEFSFKDREHWYSSPFKRTTTTEVNPTEVGVVKNKYGKYSLARSRYLEKRHGKFLSELDAVVPTKKQPGQTSETTPETPRLAETTRLTETPNTETAPEVTRQVETHSVTPTTTELPKPDPISVPETTQVANTPASRIKPNVEITTKPARMKSKISEKSFDGLRNKIQRSSLKGDDKGLARMNLHALEELTKKAGKKAAKKARDIYRRKAKPSAAYTQALEDLKKSGMTDKQARTVLKDLNAFKNGGIIKAQVGVKFPKGVSIMEIGKYFDYDLTTGNYNIKNGVNINEVNEWLKGYGLGNVRSMTTDSKDKPKDVMPKKPRNYDFSLLLDLGLYFHALNTNKKLYELGNENQPLLYDPKEDHRYIVGDLDAKLLGQRQAAEKNRFARNIANSTSDASLGAAVLLEAFGQGLNDILEGNRADNAAIKESTERAWEQEVQNHENRYNIAMKNRENIHQDIEEKLSNKAGYIKANHDSTTNYIDKLAVDMKKKHTEVSNARDFYYKQQLLGYAKRNPSQFVDGWSKYDSDVWSKGESGILLNATEQIRYDLLRELVQLGYYNVLAKLNGVRVNTPHTGWLYNAEPTIKVIKEK